LSGSCDHQHIHSFPTRRSSDLARAMGRQLEEITDAIEIVKALDPRPGQKYNRTAARTIEPDVYIVKVDGEYRALTNEDEMPQLRDRKSTSLNSSHVAISYAVFC